MLEGTTIFFGEEFIKPKLLATDAKVAKRSELLLVHPTGQPDVYTESTIKARRKSVREHDYVAKLGPEGQQ